MSKLKKQSVELKTSAGSISHCPANPSFSFEHLTPNGTFNFEFFGKDKRERNEAKAALYDRMAEISQNSWLYWYNLPKKKGAETIKAEQIKFSPTGLEISKDEKVIIFRFSYNGNDCRILGITKNNCPIFYVIGFDFNFKAYDHD